MRCDHPSTAAPASRRAHVLIVDDTPTNIDVLAAALPDYRCTVALDGPSALARARGTEPPDLVLLDVMMPGMDGLAVCTALKGDPATADIPVIFVTALDEVSDEARGFELGAVDYITKPFSPPIVRARVATHLQLLAARRELQVLVEDTLTGSIRVLTDVLGLTNPNAFSRSERIARYVLGAARELGLDEPWRLELAGRLSQVGLVALAPDLVERVDAGRPISAKERAAWKEHPRIAADLLARIPRMADVAEMIARQDEAPPIGASLDGSEDRLAVGAALIGLASKYDLLATQKIARDQALAGLGRGHHPSELVDALRRSLGDSDRSDEQAARPVGQLRVGMVLQRDVLTPAGILVMKRGSEITDTALALLCRWAENGRIQEPVWVEGPGTGSAYEGGVPGYASKSPSVNSHRSWDFDIGTPDRRGV